MAEPSNVYASGFGENEKVQRNGRREKKNADIQNLTKKNDLVCFYARPSFAPLSKICLIRNLNTWLNSRPFEMYDIEKGYNNSEELTGMNS